MQKRALAFWLGLAVALALLSGCGLRVARESQVPAAFPTLNGLRPGLTVEDALRALEASHTTVVKRTDETRERDGRTFRFDLIEAQGGGAAPFDVTLQRLRFVSDELVRIETTFAQGLTADALQAEIGPAWSNMDGTLRWYFESTQTAVEAYPGYASGGWHVVMEALGADEFKSLESRLEAIKHWEKLATAGPLPGRNILPPAWVRQSTPEEAVRSMARALREGDEAAFQYLSWQERARADQSLAAMPTLDRPRARAILALAGEGAQVVLDGDRAILKGQGAGGSVHLRRERGRWFIK